MALTVFKELFSRADAEGSRSTALKPVNWMTALVLCALLIGAGIGLPDWLMITFGLVFAGCICLFIYSYVFLLHNNSDALRSESYSLQKIAIEKGLIGDSIHGAFTPDEKNKNKLISADSKSGGNNET